MVTLKLRDGKYTVETDSDGFVSEVYRHGEKWEAGFKIFAQSGLASALLLKATELKAENEDLRRRLAAYRDQTEAQCQ